MIPRVQLDLPFLRMAPEPPVRSPVEAEFERAEMIDFVRMKNARRYVLRVRPDGSLRVTIPRGGSRAEGMRFVERHAPWIHRERARIRTTHGSRAWIDGTTILLHGQRVILSVIRRGVESHATYGDRRVSVPSGVVDLRPFVESDMRALAHAELVPTLHELAARHTLTVRRVTIRNQRSRWGSCSRNGSIALNFRLVQMPPDVCEYVLLHELMHLKQQNHSVRFWRLVERACPAFRDAERWLKTEGRSLL
jgi:predicted metal-dependent hydrolase